MAKDHSDIQSQVLNNCTYIKSILMLSIVLYHSCRFWTGDFFTRNPVETSDFLIAFTRWLDTIHIYCFAVISGYLYYHIRFERNGYTTFKEFATKKIQRLLVPYFFTAIFWAIPFQLLFFPNERSIWKMFIRYGVAYSPNQLWFLVMLFVVFILIYPIPVRLMNSNAVLYIGIACYYLGIMGDYFLPNIFQVWTASKFVVFFIIGIKIRQRPNISDRLFKTNIGSILLIAHVFLFLAYNYWVKDRLSNEIYECIFLPVLVLGSIMGFSLLNSIVSFIRKRSNDRWLVIAGKYSMGIYLFHQQIIYVMVTALNGKVSIFVATMISFFISILLSTIITYLMLRNRYTSLLIGEKYR